MSASDQPLFYRMNAEGETQPLVLDSPHSGSYYPPDFIPACPREWLRQTEDMYVDELFSAAPSLGIGLLKAHAARSYIDLNRAADDIDPFLVDGPYPTPLNPSDRSRVGHGLIRHLCRSKPVYAEKISTKNIIHRIDNYYQPYHAALREMIAQRWQNFGVVWHINCHSMPSESAPGVSPLAGSLTRPRADFVLGDLDGRSCEGAFVEVVGNYLGSKGYHVAYNDPYKGMEILRVCGAPAKGMHSLQFEINRALYMNEETFERNTNFASLQRDLTGLLQHLSAWMQSRLHAEKLAAE
jgi:N-formylglutamate deformylase